jgi:transposase
MRSKAYRGVGVKEVDAARLAAQRPGEEATVGFDVAKKELFAVVRWRDGRFERPWRVANPGEIGLAVEKLKTLASGRQLRIALEPSGTYGDALRQALHDAGLEALRISPKAAKDYAEVFDGVPSQHDGKDAAVVAELAALGKGRVWPFAAADAWEEELGYWVDGLDAQRRISDLWLGRVEGLLARHWPEATRVLKITSGTLLRVLARYGGPAGVAADGDAASRLQRWGGTLLTVAKREALLHSAATTRGIRQGEWQQRELRDCAHQVLEARRQVRDSQRQLRRLAASHAVLQAQGTVVGVPTACVLWVNVGDPRRFDSGPCYRKAMGLNLVERSSGEEKGRLHISKRGSARARQWLYFAALRAVQQAGVRRWYEAKKARDGDEAMRALVAVMRKLALALYHVGARQARFDSRRLFAGLEAKARSSARPRR